MLNYLLRWWGNYRCVFHIFTQEWLSLPTSKLSDTEKRQLKLIKDWVDSWTFNIELPEQFNDSVERLKSILFGNQNRFFNTTLTNKIKTMFDSLAVSESSWARCYKQPTMDLDHSTSSPGESTNASMKGFGTGSMSQKSLKKSSDHMIKHSASLENKRAQSVASNITTVQSHQFIIEQTSLNSHCA